MPELEPEVDEKPSEELQQALDTLDGNVPEVEQFVPTPVPDTMQIAPPKPVEEIIPEVFDEPEQIVELPVYEEELTPLPEDDYNPEEPFEEDETPIEQPLEPEHVPNPEEYVNQSLTVANEIKKYLNFAEIMDEKHHVSSFENCVSCYY